MRTNIEIVKRHLLATKLASDAPAKKGSTGLQLDSGILWALMRSDNKLDTFVAPVIRKRVVQCTSAVRHYVHPEGQAL